MWKIFIVATSLAATSTASHALDYNEDTMEVIGLYFTYEKNCTTDYKYPSTRFLKIIAKLMLEDIDDINIVAARVRASAVEPNFSSNTYKQKFCGDFEPIVSAHK